MDYWLRSRADGIVCTSSMRAQIERALLRNLARGSASTRVQLASGGSVVSLRLDASDGARYLLSATADRRITIFDTQSTTANNTSMAQVSTAITRDNSMLTSAQWYAPDTGLFVTAGDCVRLYDANAMREVHSFEANDSGEMVMAMSVAARPWGAAGLASCLPQLIAVAAPHGQGVTLLDLRSGSVAHHMRRGNVAAGSHVGPDGWSVTAIAWNRWQPFMLATGTDTGYLEVWDVRQAIGPMLKMKRFGSQGPQRLRDSMISARGHGSDDLSQYGPIRRLRVTQHVQIGRRKAACSRHPYHAGAVPRVNQPTFESASSGTGACHHGAVNYVQFVNSGLDLVSSGRDGRVRLWDVSSGHNQLVHFDTRTRIHRHGNRSSVCGIAVSNVGALLSMFYPSGTNLLWLDGRSGRQLGEVGAGVHFDSISRAEFDENRIHLYIGDCAGSVFVYRTQNLDSELKANHSIDAVAWSSDESDVSG